MAIVELAFLDFPAIGAGFVPDALPDVADPSNKGRLIGLTRISPLDLRHHGFENLVGEVIDQRHEEMAAAHRGIAHFEIEDGDCRIESEKFFDPYIRSARILCQLPSPIAKSSQPFIDQRSDSALDDKAYQFFGRVVTPAALACERIELDGDSIVLGNNDVFQQPFINRAEMLNRQVTVVDAPRRAGGTRWPPR
ncbi:MAG: hypothetical protein ACRD9W_29690 [Terriglobia bacterium]